MLSKFNFLGFVKTRALWLCVALIASINAAALSFTYTSPAGAVLTLSSLSNNEAEVAPGDYSGDIVIPEKVEYNRREYTVTSIGKNAFAGCMGLCSVAMPSTIRQIKENAFGWCSALATIAVGPAVEKIMPYAFQGCSAIEAFKVDGANATYKADDGVIYSADGTTLVVYPPGKAGAYYLPSTVTKIAEGAMYDCVHLSAVQIPLSVTEIGRNAMYFCGGVGQVAIPEGVTSIARGAFGECSQLSAFSVAPANSKYHTDGSALYAKADDTLVQFAPYGSVEYEVAAGTKGIGPEAFFRCYDLQSVELPESLTTIGDIAFAECWDLRSVHLPASVKSIGFGAFALCKSIESVYVGAASPSSIKLGDCAFFDVPTSTAVLYVPQGSRAAYAKASQWKEFENIREFTSTLPQHIAWTQELDTLHVGDMVWLEAKTSSGLEPEYRLAEGTDIAQLSGARLKLLRPGRVVVEALQGGNSQYLPAAPVTKTIDVSNLGIEDINADCIEVQAGMGVITITGAPQQSVAKVYTTSGMLAYSGTSRRILVSEGLYVVAIEGITAKVLVR